MHQEKKHFYAAIFVNCGLSWDSAGFVQNNTIKVNKLSYY